MERLDNISYLFFESDDNITLGFVIIVVSLIIIITLLIIIINQKKKNEMKMNSNYEELTAVYEELTATEEELRTQYNELLYSQEIIKNDEQRYRLAIEGANDTIWEWDIENHKFFISDKWQEVTGYETLMNLDELCVEYIHKDDKERVKKDLDEALDNCHILKTEFRLIVKNGELKWFLNRASFLMNNKGKTVKAAGSLTDITDIKVKEREYKQLAFFDTITNLPNRNLFIIKFRELLEKSNKENKKVALLFLDIDEFKKVNDTMGHDKGDLLLKILAERLEAEIPKDSVIGRFGGDEFLVLIPNLENETILHDICVRILDIFKAPFYLNEAMIYVTTSIGVVVTPDDGKDVETLLKNADTAMYKAKELGKNQFCRFTETIGKQVIRNILIENNLRSALAKEEFIVYYQPQIDIATGKIKGMEALLRWNNSELGFVPPNEFIPIAEKTGLIVPIGSWVLDTVCSQNAKWHEKGYKYNTIAINVSCIQFMREDFIDIVVGVLDKSKLEHQSLEIEITESIFMESTEEHINKLKKLKDMGIKISLDDFGTGYSSLNYLRRLPIDVLKIDQSFIQDICTKAEQKLITDVMIDLSHKMGYKVVAEGVEVLEQLNLLKSMQCDIAQGYYFSKPVNSIEMEKLLIEN